MKYSYYEYEVYQEAYEGKMTWNYKILLNDPQYTFWTGEDSIESDEWYETEQETIDAAHEHIDKLEDGPDEPDYDAPTAEEMYQRAHDDRQKLRGY